MTEELHHRGEIIAILWQKDIQPPDMRWLSVMRKIDTYMEYEIILYYISMNCLSRRDII